MIAETGHQGRPRYGGVWDYLLCLSLANLHCLNLWLEAGNRGFDFFRATRPDATMLWAVLALVLVLSLVFWAALQLWRRVPSAIARPAAIGGIVVSLVLPAGVLHRTTFDPLIDAAVRIAGRMVVYSIVAVLATALLIWVVRRTDSAARVYAAALSLALPIAPALALHATWVQLHRPPEEAYAGAAVALSDPDTRTRVIVMVFDEWDQRLSVEARPGRIQLPALNHLLARSFSATRAAGGGFLGMDSSIKSMLTGQRLEPIDPQSVGVDFHAGGRRVIDPAAAWADQPTVFSELRERGWSSAVAGWYIPYCRLLGEHLRGCTWEPGGSVYARRELSSHLPFVQTFAALAERQIGRVPLSRRLGLDNAHEERRRLLAEEVARLKAAALAVIDTAEFVYVHWPLPHPFGMPDSKRSVRGTAANYVDNLVLADELLGDVHQHLTRAGRWDEITLIATSDHSLRTWYWEASGTWTDEERQLTEGRQWPFVPFIVKFRGTNDPLFYDQPYTVALLYDVVLAIADGAVANPAELAAWLDIHRHRHPVDPYARRQRRTTVN